MQYWLFIGSLCYLIIVVFSLDLPISVFCFLVSRQVVIGLGVVLSLSFLCYPMYITLYFI